MRRNTTQFPRRTIAVTGAMIIAGAGMAWQTARSATIPDLAASVVAVNIPGASAISQVGIFLNASQGACGGSPIATTYFTSYTQKGAVLDPARILVGSNSNFGAPPLTGVGQEGSVLSIDPTGPVVLSIPATFASSGGQASALAGHVQMFSANSADWLNSINNPSAFTKQYSGVSNPLGLSNNNAFGRVWPANAPFGDSGIGSSSILDATGLPLASPNPPFHAPNALIGGVYAGDLTNRSKVTGLQQVIAGALNTGAVGTALLGPSPDGSCKAVFAVVTADGAIVQEHTAKGLDGLAPIGTIKPLQGQSWDPPNQSIQPRLGVLMNPYVPSGAPSGTVQQLFVSEPFNNTIAVVDLTIFGTAPNQVFGLGSVSRIASSALNLPVDLAAAVVDKDDANWASNTTLDEGSDLYVANRGNNTIVRMKQDGSIVAIRHVAAPPGPLNNASLNGIATSSDGSTIYATFTRPGHSAFEGGVLELPAFP